jgi:uncharacterized protein
MTDEVIISHTTAWIKSVVIGCHFCPFAAQAILKKSIRYVVLREATIENTLEKLIYELHHLDITEEVETTLIILPDHFEHFEGYLSLVEVADTLIARLGYEGVYQIASFHPQYIFAESYEEDPANYTNRSVYPMLHLLREASITEAIEHYPDAEGIPQRNIDFANRKGLPYMKMLWAACLEI